MPNAARDWRNRPTPTTRLDFVLTCLRHPRARRRRQCSASRASPVRSLARSRSSPATIKQVADGAEGVRGSAYRPLPTKSAHSPVRSRFSRRTWIATATSIAQVLEDTESARRAHPSHRSLGRRLPRSDRRRAARRHRRRDLDARHRPDHRQRLVRRQRPRAGRLRRDRAGFQQRFRRAARRRSSPLRSRKSAARCANRPAPSSRPARAHGGDRVCEIEGLAAATQRIDGVLSLIQAIAQRTRPSGARRDDRSRARRRRRPRFCGRRPRGQGARRSRPRKRPPKSARTSA